MNDRRKSLCEEYSDEFLFMDPCEYDEAIIGVAEVFGGEATIAYDRSKVLKVNMSMGMTEDEAEEHFYYNQIGAYVGDKTPIFVELT